MNRRQLSAQQRKTGGVAQMDAVIEANLRELGYGR